jgi:general secretion pathway protein G
MSMRNTMKTDGKKMSALRRAHRGFSLLELTLVLAIIAILMAAAAWNFVGQGERAKVKVTKQTMSIVESALTQYNLEYSGYPPQLNVLISSKMLKNQPLTDAWSSELYYDTRGANKDRAFNLRSPGPDKQLGNEDDIDIWTMTREGAAEGK